MRLYAENEDFYCALLEPEDTALYRDVRLAQVRERYPANNDHEAALPPGQWKIGDNIRIFGLFNRQADPVGNLVLRMPDPGEEPEAKWMFVSKTLEGRHLSALLLQSCAEHIREAGHTSIYGRVFHTNNRSAHALEHNGWTRARTEQPGEYFEDGPYYIYEFNLDRAR